MQRRGGINLAGRQGARYDHGRFQSRFRARQCRTRARKQDFLRSGHAANPSPDEV